MRNLLSTLTRIKLSTTLRTLQARWPYPRNHFYLCFASCSLYRYAALPTTCYIMLPILPCSSFFFRSTHSHRISYLAYHTCFASCCLRISRCWLWFRLFVFLSWVEPGDEFVNEEPVEYAYEDQAFDNSENLAGKMTTPRNHFSLCFASYSLYWHAALPITCYIMPPILPCQPLTILS